MTMEEKKKEEVSEDTVFRALKRQLLATPYSAPLHYNLGLAYARRGQLDESATAYHMEKSSIVIGYYLNQDEYESRRNLSA